MPSSLSESHGNKTIVSANYLTQEGARSLARTIEKYWVEEGYKASGINVQVVRDDHAEAYFIRSNLRNGTPPGKPLLKGVK